MKPIIISGDESGEFNCDGKADQVQINAAFNYQKENPEYSLFLKGPFTYTISDTILTSNNFTLEGDKDAILTVSTDTLWAAKKQLIKQDSPDESEPNDKRISGFIIDGNADILNAKYAASKGKKELRGDGYYNLIELSHGTIEVSDMVLRNSPNDGLISRYSDTIFKNNIVYNLGHEALYAKKCSVEEAFNNIKTMTNSGGRIQDCSGSIKIHDNKIWTEYGPDAGGPGLQIQFTKSSACPSCNDVEIWNNTILDTYGPGIWLVAYGGLPYSREDAGGVHIHDNTFRGCGTHPSYNWLAGITLSGFYDTRIENNTFDGCYGAAIDYCEALGLSANGTSGKYNTIIQGNEIKNTVKRKGGADASNSGQAIRNRHPSNHTFQIDSNYIFDNVGGAYINCSSTTDIYHAPVTQEQEAVLMIVCTEAELIQIKEKYPEKTILRRT